MCMKDDFVLCAFDFERCCILFSSWVLESETEDRIDSNFDNASPLMNSVRFLLTNP